MSDTKQAWTPGPWEVNGSRDDDHDLTVEARGGEVAFIAITLGYAHADEANAKLISAAPELVEALRQVMDAHDDMTGAERQSDSYRAIRRYSKAREVAEAALQKAGAL